MDMLEDYLCRSEIMEYFCISKSTYSRWLHKKLLKPIKKGNTRLYHIDDIRALVKHFENCA